MLHFSKLRIAGFKSFVEPTELQIETGMTGIVGPNGCGKSNLVEALKWVMGETSAKQLRGGGMDDVIFGGTASRPARSLAEVTLQLDNTSRLAPPPFHDSDQLDVSRRIERDKGSCYRVNGKELRARDVQLLFADAATGARSTALVNQGHVGEIIAAKPAHRRKLLEEAAGISGLHSRRHEAELRLRGAETNLERLEDVLAALETQLQSLKKQARQAIRYRTVSDLIRKTEAMVLHARWIAARAAAAAALEQLEAAQAAVGEIAAGAGAISARQATAAAALPELRQAEADAASALQRLIVARDGLDAEEQRVAADRQSCHVRREQITADLDRERALVSDAETAIENLSNECARLQTARQGEGAARAAAETALAGVAAEVEARDGELTDLNRRVAADEARRAALKRSLDDLEGRKQRLTARAAAIAGQKQTLEREIGDAVSLEAVDTAAAEAQALAERAALNLDAAEVRRAETADQANAALLETRAAEASLARLEAEAAALAGVLDTGGADEEWPAVVDTVSVPKGLEAALAAALGDDLTASLDQAAPAYWCALPPSPDAPALPDGIRPLNELINGPGVLGRRLAQVGVVGTDADGDALQSSLRQGQRLVSRAGAMWRWDGFVASTGAAPSAAAARLEQRNRLEDVRAMLSEEQASAARIRDHAAQRRQAADAAAEAERAARQARQRADADFHRARDIHAEARRRAAEQQTRLIGLSDSLAAMETERAEAEAPWLAATEEFEALPEIEACRAPMAALRETLGRKRAVLVERQAMLTSLDRDAHGRRRRLQAVGEETQSWTSRRDGARRQIDIYAARKTEVEAELERLSALPGEIAQKRRAVLDDIETAEQRRRDEADRLAVAETGLAEADRALRATETALAQAREDRVRAEGAVAQAEQSCHEIAERIADRLEVPPDSLSAITGLHEGGDAIDLEATERRLERLRRERDVMGPVNLRAEHEATELASQIETMTGERVELLEAIRKLRQGIGELDREGRERLLASFSEVDRHFRELFQRLFGGGRAHLTLTESDDPLEAGLEIMASPPGKRLQALSLLSGGEQALTALALLFAVFQTNPAPICVLDEVDAPLDDANVDRFCSLVEHMAEGGTRFLIITHHRMTMARMDRLFGVTMAERGVSQLVSVDLQQAEALRQTA